jgi:short-subunit dehydrogenase
MDLGLQGKNAIVTGGSRGIGKAIARELAREGADVAIVARKKVDLEATARELAAETNRRIVPLAADVSALLRAARASRGVRVRPVTPVAARRSKGSRS